MSEVTIYGVKYDHSGSKILKDGVPLDRIGMQPGVPEIITSEILLRCGVADAMPDNPAKPFRLEMIAGRLNAWLATVK
jgi:hypothetical protein